MAHQSRRPPSDCAHANRCTQQHVRARARTQPNQRRALSFGGAPRARRTQRSRPFLRKRPPPGPLGSAKALGLRFARGHFARPLRATTCVRTATPSLLSLKFLPRNAKPYFPTLHAHPYARWDCTGGVARTYWLHMRFFHIAYWHFMHASPGCPVVCVHLCLAETVGHARV